MKIKFTPSPNQLRIKHLIRNSKKQKFLCDIYISLNRTLSDRIDYPKQFRIRNPIRHSLPITPSDRIFYPKPFRIKNPIRRGFLKKNLSDRISYPKPFRIENPIRIGRRMKRCGQATKRPRTLLASLWEPWWSPFKVRWAEEEIPHLWRSQSQTCVLHCVSSFSLGLGMALKQRWFQLK